MEALLAAIDDPGTVIVALAGLFGTVFVAIYQGRVTLKQVKQSHAAQMELLRLSQERDEQQRKRQFEEADRADRLLVLEYIDQLLPRLTDSASIYFLSGGPLNQDEAERYRFNQLKRFMDQTAIDHAHPERALSLRMAFLLFQLLASMRSPLNARWRRPLSDAQVKFLAHYEDQIEPILCSGRYPGDELLYREQIEIITDEMLLIKHNDIVRPLNWKEFCEALQENGVLNELANLVASRIRFIFDDTNPKSAPPRRAMQCRLAILALYLIQMSEEAGNAGWKKRQDLIWRVVASWFAWQQQKGQQPAWFVFTRGDVEEKLAEIGTTQLPGIGAQTQQRPASAPTSPVPIGQEASTKASPNQSPPPTDHSAQ